MKVDQRELAAAPVSHVVAAEPIRSSVVGAGRPVNVRPPTAVLSRPVVAVRTPPAPPRPIEQRQAQAGGHLNQQVLVRPAGPSQPAQVNQRRTAAAESGRLPPVYSTERWQQPGSPDSAVAAPDIRAAGKSGHREQERTARKSESAGSGESRAAYQSRLPSIATTREHYSAANSSSSAPDASGAGAFAATGAAAGAEV